MPSIRLHTLHRTWATLPLEPRKDYAQGNLTAQGA
jgi:hypothetical protein